MKYLKSTTQKTYTFSGQHIPACVTKDNEVLALNDPAYKEFTKSAVVKALISSGAIIVLDKAPESANQQVKTLTNKTAELSMENTKLHEEIAELKRQLTDSGNNAEVASLKAALAKQVEDDTAEIKALQEAKDARIAELEAQLAAATAAPTASTTTKKGQKGE